MVFIHFMMLITIFIFSASLDKIFISVSISLSYMIELILYSLNIIVEIF